MPVQNINPTGDLRIDALLGVQQWATSASGPLELTYSFPDDSSVWSTAAGDYGAGDDWGPQSGIAALSELEKSAVRATLDVWAAVANIQFIETADNATGSGILRFAWTASSAAEQSFTYAPGSSAKAGDVWLNSLAPWDGFDPGSYGFSTLIHEIGHALGLKHPFEGAVVLPLDEESYAFSLMSYTAYAGSTGSWVDFEPTTPMLYDILAIQSLYGTNWLYREGDDTYAFSADQQEFATLWDAWGNDTIVWQSASRGVWIDLTEGTFSELGAPLTYWTQDFSSAWTDGLTVSIAYGTWIENANGGDGSDVLIGNAFDNRLATGLGNDLVYGGAGHDTVVLPMFPNVYSLAAYEAGEVFGNYAGWRYQLDLFDVESAEFGRFYQTTLPLNTLVSGDAQLQLGRLTDLYLAFFGRAPDVSGLEYWQEKLLEEGRDFATISKDFAWSEEAQALFPPAASNRAFVQTVYANCFGRTPDAGGWDYWTGRLDGLGSTGLNERGAFVGEVILGAYAPSSGEEDRTLLINRHEAALYYVNQLAVDPSENFDSGINALLDRVNGDARTRAGAQDVIDYAFANPVTLSGILADPVLLDAIWGI